MGMINLALGWPSTRLLPKEFLSKAATELLLTSSLVDEALLYGPDPGSEPLRAKIASWLTDFYTPHAGPISSSRIFIGNGASASLGVILRRFTDPSYTRRIWMIEPTYFMACPMFEGGGFVDRLRGVPEDEEGIDIAFLQRNLEQVDRNADSQGQTTSPRYKHGARFPKIYRHVIYVVPTFSNPSGKVMSIRRRQQLVQLARKHDALIIADDVYDMLRWPSDPEIPLKTIPPPHARITDIDRQLEGCTEFGNSCSNGSFSKIVAPGVRVSWVEGTEQFAFTLSSDGDIKSGGCPSQMTSLMIYHLLESGLLDNHLQNSIIPAYRTRYAVMKEAIQTHLEPYGIRMANNVSSEQYRDVARSFLAEENASTQAGGYFAYIIFPDNTLPVAQIASIAAEFYNVKILPGNSMVAAGDPESIERSRQSFGRGARLSWSWLEPEEILAGIQRLATLMKDVSTGNVRSGPQG